MFERDVEWANLSRFAADRAPELRLGIVWGRRRQGKSFLLQALAEAGGGFYYEAFAGTSADLLSDLGSKLARHRGIGVPLRLASWDDAIDAFVAPRSEREERPLAGPLVVFDEFPFLAAAERALPSLVARALSPRGEHRGGSRVRLVLCGSALHFMASLLGGSAPLRGRAGLEQVVSSFDYRTARAYWKLRDPRLAVLTFAVVGGTPAYKREFLRDDAPRSLRDFDAWVCRTVLDPASSLFREGRVLVEEEPQLSEMGLYHSVLAAIASGDRKPSSIASRVGRPLNALPHALSVLSDVGLVERHTDAFRSNRTEFEIVEPIVAFHHALMRPSWAALERGRAEAVWAASTSTFSSKIVGPTFERICRHWTRDFASDETRGAAVVHVGRGTVADPDARTSHEVDVVALDGRRICVLGEVKWGEPVTAASIARLEHIRALLGARGWDVSKCRLLYFTGTTSHVAAPKQVDVVDLVRLYEGE